MFENVDLDFYKEYLCSFFKYEIDNDEVKKKERKRYLEQHYSNDMLIEIIENTKEFICGLLEKVLGNQNSYFEFEIMGNLHYISTNCSGGYNPDILIPIDDIDGGKLISKFLLRTLLGSNIIIEIDYEEIEVWDEDNEFIVGCIYQIPKLKISGNFNELINYYKNNDKLVRKLKQNN